MNEAGFYFIALCLCVFAVLSVTTRNVFHGALWLAFALISIACVYFYLDAEFLGAVQILIYVGGIMTLFIFAIKLTARIDDRMIRQANRQFWPGLVVGGVLFAVIVAIIGTGPLAHLNATSQVADVKVIGRALVTSFALPFEFVSLLLLAAMVGAIVIGKVKK